MSNAIQFLENLGRNPELVGGSGKTYAVAVATSELDAVQRQALLDCDVEGLRDLLGGREKMRCVVCTPDEADFQDDVEESRRDLAH